MSKHQSVIEELAALKAEYATRTAAIREKALSELNEQLKNAKAEVVRLEAQIAQLTGSPVGSNAVETGSTATGKRLKPIAEGGEEWMKVAKQIAIVLKNYKDGLNGKELAYKLGLQAPRDIRRIQPVIAATTLREGAGAATRYFLQN